MISIFSDLEGINFPIDKHINHYTDLYLKKNKEYQYYYDEYSNIEKIQIKQSLRSEILNYQELDENSIDFHDLTKEINSHFIKSCLLESLKLVVEIKSSTDKEISKRIKKYKKKYNYYPEIGDYQDYEIFLIDFSKRKEFNIHHIPKNKNKSCDIKLFELQRHQLFLKNLFSYNTPYNGILIFHGVGVGKTCSGISISENFKNLDSRIIILAPDKIQEGWKKNIYNPDKGSEQCTGYEYIDEEDKYISNKDKLVNDKIKEYYEMYGYLAFSNSVKKYLEENLRHIPENDILSRKNEEIRLIKAKYSDTVLIIDEVHKIRTEDESKSRDTLKYIEKVISYSSNLKLILLTANPMYNQPDEIIWILNMLLLNDNRSKITAKNINYETVNDKLILTKESREMISEKSKGYVSYLRGENPYTFPHRLYPQRNLLTELEYDIHGSKLTKKTFEFLKLYESKIKKSSKQFDVYYSELLKISDSLSIDEEAKLLQLSNCVYPVDSDNVNDLYGDDGIKNCFNTVKGKYAYKKNIPNFLDLDNLKEYSSKIHSIITEINNTEGIIFIYSNYLSGGILPMILALEQNGYKKYDGQVILSSKNKKDPINYQGKRGPKEISAKYMVIAGNSLRMTGNFKKEMKIVTGDDNINGEKIKIIIGSSVAAEGLDFKNIRAIHLLEPWHNINKLEQVIGRGIRNCSHSLLDKEKQNVTIYFHTTTFTIKDARESIETYLYRRCERKAFEIGLIELELKKTAIDKYLFQNANFIKEQDIDEIKLNPAHKSDKSITIKPYDKGYSRSCSFLSDCDYFKDLEFSINTNKKVKNDTFSIEYSQSLIDVYKNKIKDIILEYVYVTLEDIIKQLKLKIDNVLDEIIYHAIDQMIENKYIIKKNDIVGYLNYSDNYYYFQPSYTSDIFIDTYGRFNEELIDHNDYKITSKGNNKINIEEIQIFTKEEIENKYDEIINTNLSSKENLVIDLNLFTEEIKYSYIIDRLRFKDKCILLFSVLSHLLGDIILDKKYNKFIKYLIDEYSELFIYFDEEESNYKWFPKYEKENLSKLYGCFLYFHEREQYYLFHYEGNKLILCNELEKKSILSIYSLINSKTIYNKNYYSYLKYNKNYKLVQNGIVLKIKKEKDKEGSIFLSSSSSEWSYENGIKFIKSKYIDYWSEINKKNKDILTQKSKTDKKINKLTIGILIELIMRSEKNLIKPDIFWLYKYVK